MMETIVLAITLENVDEDTFQGLLLKTCLTDALTEFSDDFAYHGIHWSSKTVDYDEAHVAIVDRRTIGS